MGRDGLQQDRILIGVAKAPWLLAHHRDLLTGARLARQSDFINRRLVGAPVATDTSNALKTDVDLVNERRPQDVFAALSVPETLLPPVARAGAPLGVVGREAAAETGIPAGTPVFAGMTDGCAAQIGAGALSLGSWNVVLGTTLVLKGVTSEPFKDPGGTGYSHRSPDGH